MNCCDYGCNQGRDCPARVAKVGQKSQAAEPLPESVWRYQLKRLAYWALLALGVNLLLVMLLALMR